MSAVTTLFDAIVDYAGLFPPAKLPMPEAVRAFADYAHGKHADMLGRFVCPLARLGEFEAAFAALPAAKQTSPKWQLSVIVATDPAAEWAAISAFNARQPVARIVSIETKINTVDDVSRVTSAFPTTIEVWVEFAVIGDVTKFAEAIKKSGRGAKVRTGGVTPDAFPAANDVIRFFRACRTAGVVAKATAGLHHPLRGDYRLTYDNGAPKGPMFGFLNVFLAAALIHKGGSDADAGALLEERDAKKFKLTDETVQWRTHKFSVEQLSATRRELCRSFGSCSFTEPVEGLQQLRWL